MFIAEYNNNNLHLTNDKSEKGKSDTHTQLKLCL